jgi:hypothetical protein
VLSLAVASGAGASIGADAGGISPVAGTAGVTVAPIDASAAGVATVASMLPVAGAAGTAGVAGTAGTVGAALTVAFVLLALCAIEAGAMIMAAKAMETASGVLNCVMEKPPLESTLHPARAHLNQCLQLGTKS